MAAFHEKGVVHRDLHSMNAMIHFESLKPTEEELIDPYKYWREILPQKKRQCIEDLHDKDKFDIIIIDLGYAKVES